MIIAFVEYSRAEMEFAFVCFVNLHVFRRFYSRFQHLLLCKFTYFPAILLPFFNIYDGMLVNVNVYVSCECASIILKWTILEVEDERASVAECYKTVSK